MVMSNNRVLHVLDKLTPDSGVASVVMMLVSGIKEFTQDIAVYGDCDPLMKKEVISHGGNVYVLPNITQRLGVSYAKAFSALLQENPPYGVVHGHLLNSAFIYLREALHKQVPVRIIHAHSAVGADTFGKRMRNSMLSVGISRWANTYVAVSEKAAQLAFNKSNKEIHIISNGINTSQFQYSEVIRKQIREELRLADNVLCIGHVARFSALKNHMFLLDVFKAMRVHTNCILVLVGDGPLVENVKSAVHTAGLSDYVKFLGARHDVNKLYQAFDVFLLPSLSEGFGLVAVEAQCAGLGCVVSEHVPTTVSCSDYIRFLPLDDVNVWAKTAFDMIQHNRADGADSVLSAELDAKTMCDKILEVYQ